MVKREQVIATILKCLAEDPRGLTIQELADLAKTSRITAAVALAKLDGQGKIDVREIGNCKLHYLKKGVQI